jgi:valyl-tRNA synthetase
MNIEEMPNKYNPKDVEAKLIQKAEEKKLYKFTYEDGQKIFSIDTPPPTVSGRMHLGHALSFSQMDFIARYKRMQGYAVFYPFGTDDNGIATEIFVEKKNNVRATTMSRAEFAKLCLDTLAEIKPGFIQDWKDIGLSCDYEIFYSTIDERSQKISQKSFIDLYNKGLEYRKDAPALWCPHCQTAVSQVETEDKELSSYFNDVIFKVDDSDLKDLIIATTRPELIPAVVAVFVNPDDERYKHYLGKKAIVPLFNYEVPIIADKRVDKEKGTGAVMCSTFGDQVDMEWYFAYNLPLRDVVAKNGRLQKFAGKYNGMNIKEARIAIINDLKKEGLLVSQKAITHAVKVHERCKHEIEILHSKQWFIKYLDIRDKMLEWGNTLNWHPQHMKVRYDHWIKGLQWDWLISRQRFHGIPIPVWYCEKCGEVILPNESDLPVDPTKENPPVKECPRCGHTRFIPEKDVMDTWATSSLTPELAIDRLNDDSVKNKLFPMSLRPQAHDIITFWLFNTVVKSQLHYNVNPWKDVMISGHAQDSKGKKMSKSLGNIIEPQKMIEKYSADALRYWAATSKLGDDLPFQEKDLVTGIKLSNKLWNASRFVLMHLKDYEQKDVELQKIDQWLLSKLHKLIKKVTEFLDNYEYSKARLEVDKFFWNVFCDNYLEIVKDRLYNPDRRGKNARASAQYTLYTALLSLLKMMAPIMPFITDEIYSFYFSEKEGKESIHLSSWPEYDETMLDENAEKLGDLFIRVLEKVRKAKSDANFSLKTPVKELIIESPLPEDLYLLVDDDLAAVTKADEIIYKENNDEKIHIKF